MSSSSGNTREWMYQRKDPITGGVSDEFMNGLRDFVSFARMQEITKESGRMICPCRKCKNQVMHPVDTVCRHLHSRGFVPGYNVWCFHGENPNVMVDHPYYRTPSTSVAYEHPTVGCYTSRYDEPMYTNPYAVMVGDAFHRGTSDQQNPFFEETSFDGGFEQTSTVHEEPNGGARRLFEMLEMANQPLYEGCQEGHSRISLSSRMMSTKTDYNVQEGCMDSFCGTIREYLPQPNNAPQSYYEIKSTMKALGMPVEKIDVCKNDCMLFWGEDKNLQQCKFCYHNRYRTRNPATKKSTPYKRMHYLPLKYRLRRLYESQRTAHHMRWHADHATIAGDMQHPSDGKAWKDFNRSFPHFSAEPRNVYLCLCTDGFSPYGQAGSQYSLWPVILSPYNLPPEMCLKKEVMFLTVLIPGPDHPKKSFDVFLQPLIKELTELWNDGVTAWDVSLKQNFTLRAVLLWTISDFPAYGMLSGWSTHGKLACPYCMDETDSFRLDHGRKATWYVHLN